ncbi:ArsI/CadI family heavy metal resistance metalloenzyme [Acanthopleuribacter pedis]|uniref:VOC family protein n=1 Tax=Acanthopleuribacter pedis TaxID=442870 RepID=A0A8J7QBN4_9BACT|nr:ArsI/CadI family heavy metal resistance metalloenzyme [Acanthopleuribacter pedis]MBO1321144.1 VOC family protein [Acanthopleuribacter pedis]
MTIQHSAVDFAGPARFHLALNVADIKVSTAFYSALLEQAPTKERPGYAKFEVAHPSINLTLNQSAKVGAGALSHMGVQLKDTGQLARIRERLTAAGLVKSVETDQVCCYAKQDKIWVADPDGNMIEFFVVLEADSFAEDDPAYVSAQQTGAAAAAATGCCG